MARRNFKVELARQERQLRRAFVRVMREIAGAARLGDVYGVEDVMRQLEMDAATMRDILERMRDLYILGGDSAAVAAFDLRAPGASVWLSEQGAQFVRQITQAQREAIAVMVAAGVAEGRTPRQIALDIIGHRTASGTRRGGVIGITEAQAQYVVNMRRELLAADVSYFQRARRSRAFDRVVRRHMSAGEAVPSSILERATASYADNLLQLRGETIAQTEALRAFNAGRNEVWVQAADKGKVDRHNVRRVWRAVMDSRTRDIHAGMDGQEVGLEEPFIDADGNRYMYPGDTSLGAPAEAVINCRCMLMTFASPLGVR